MTPMPVLLHGPGASCPGAPDGAALPEALRPGAGDRASSPEPAAAQRRLLTALARLLGAAHGTLAVHETHLSTVLVAGGEAYKIKKPIRLPFADFSTLALRRRFCEEELRRNARFAPELYVGVVPITGSLDAPVIGGTGEPLEAAVHMKAFPADALATQALARGELVPSHVDALAVDLAGVHSTAARAVAPPAHAAPPLALALDNCDALASVMSDPAQRALVAAVRRWTIAEHRRRAASFASRLRQGHVRECHGDLHLGNVVLIDGRLRMFDALEFDPALACIDVMSDLAFLVMDLEMHGRRDLAWRLLDAYLQRTGDYAAVPVLRYYFVYRAMVRAKIEAIRAAQQEDAEAREGWMRCSRYLRLAARETRTAHPGLVLMHGLSGSGKSTVSQGLLEHARLIRVRTDVERRRLQDARDTPSAGIATGAYAPRMDRITYLNAAAIACVALRAGHGVIVDGAFLQRWQRDLLRGIARRLQVPCCIVHCAAPAPVLQARIEARRAAQSDASEATAAVLAHQQRHADPLDDAEWAAAITVASTHAASALWPRVRRLLRRLRQDSSK